MESPERRDAPLELSQDEFRRAGHVLVDRIADHLAWIQDRSNPVTRAESPEQVRSLLGRGGMPQFGTSAERLLEETAGVLFDHSLFNGHPRFWGYVTSSPASIGVLGDMLAATINANVGAYALSPVATEIERQTVRWIAELIGYAPGCGGLLVSGGNMANFVCFLAARKAKIPWDVRTTGVAPSNGQAPRMYCSAETHTWIQKAADLFGFGSDAVAWIPADNDQRMNVAALEKRIADDRSKGMLPFLVIGTAGTVGTGAVDPLEEIGNLCKREGLWFHVDGAYGGFAAILPESPPDFHAFHLADSVAVDPHKWLYAPLEAGCALVKDPKALLETFSYHPEYYHFDEHADEELTNFYELGLQNSRGFRALKVWLALRQAGREGYVRMIRDDCAIARHLHVALKDFHEIEAMTHHLSITTFRYVPMDLRPKAAAENEYLNKLNTEILSRIQASGKAYPSNALVDGIFGIRVCVVNFRSTVEDVLALPPLVVATGREVDHEMRN